MEVYVEPLVEWRQMFHEVWRLERDFFYDAGAHGLDLAAAEKRYAPYLEGVASRQDLNYLFEEMLGELTCGHVFVGGGDLPEVKRVGVGLLGADYRIENGRYRFARVYDGENWNPQLRAPLTQPGVNVAAGEYLLAVNGKEVTAAEEVYKPFEATAGKQTVIKVGPSPDGKGAREVTVVPVGGESGLRTLAWVEDNRRKVDPLSGGKLAYVWLPDTAEGGYSNFNRYYFAQIGKQGAVVDERFNQGGLIADYIIDYMRRPLMGYFAAARRRRLHHARGLHLRAQGHDHQRVRRLGRRHDAVALPGGRDRAARREADLGRPGRHGRGGSAHGRRLHRSAAERLLEPQRDLGRREPRRRPRFRGRDGPGLGHGRSRSPAREGRPGGSRPSGQKPAAEAQEAGLSGLSEKEVGPFPSGAVDEEQGEAHGEHRPEETEGRISSISPAGRCRTHSP